MLTRSLICIFFLFSSSLFSQEKALPTIIDFSTFDSSEIPGYENFDLDSVKHLQPFNGALEMAPFFFYLKDAYAIENAVETGTQQGNTAAFFGYLFNEVFAVEKDNGFYFDAVHYLRYQPNVTVCHGNSPDILHQILPSLEKERLLIYLDAHSFSDWPLLSELEEISETHRDNCILVIDDIKVPGRLDVPFDSYAEDECSYEYVCRHLEKIFSSYSFHYLIPKSVDCRAKFVAIPVKWKQ